MSYLMMAKSSKFLFLGMLVWSLIMLSLVENMVLVWIILEINMMCFIPLMKSGGSYKISASMMKYFLVQALGSFFVLYSLVVILEGGMSLFIVLGLLVKLGNPPSFLWLPSVMKSVGWYTAIILSSVQKVPSLLVFSGVSELSFMVLVLCLMGFVVSGVGGVMQTQLLALMAYSSMAHMSWVLLGLMLNVFIGWVYFFIYVGSVIVLFQMCDKLMWFKLAELNVGGLYLWVSMMMVLSMAGLPPFLGFFSKLLVFQNLMGFSMVVVAVILGFMGFNLYFYSNLVFLIFSKGGLSFKMSGLSIISSWVVVVILCGGFFLL